MFSSTKQKLENLKVSSNEEVTLTVDGWCAMQDIFFERFASIAG